MCQEDWSETIQTCKLPLEHEFTDEMLTQRAFLLCSDAMSLFPAYLRAKCCMDNKVCVYYFFPIFFLSCCACGLTPEPRYTWWVRNLSRSHKWFISFRCFYFLNRVARVWTKRQTLFYFCRALCLARTGWNLFCTTIIFVADGAYSNTSIDNILTTTLNVSGPDQNYRFFHVEVDLVQENWVQRRPNLELFALNIFS